MKFFKNISKTTKIHMGLLILFSLLLVLLITRFEYVFGSNVDWMKQHIVFPDYFRNLFYETGNLFPNLAQQLGGGQNIYYFAYYGLLSPIILISYLLPFIPMGTYLIISSILLIIVSAISLYYFLRKNNFTNNVCFISTLLFLFSSSFIFHFHRHLMFVNYMPFLILALIGVYRYFEKKKSGLLIISIFLMILTSYYYSVSGLITICIYGLYYYLKITPKIMFKDLLKASLSFILRIILGILLSAVLLAPVIYVTINGRTTNSINIDLSLFIPQVDYNYLMYGTYGIGLTSIIWISLIFCLIYLKKEYKISVILFSILITLPIFNYLLNGGLYLNGKVFIPLLPLCCLFISSMIKHLKDNKISFKWLIISVLVSLIVLVGFKYNIRVIYMYIEIFLMLIILYLFNIKKKYYFLIPILLVASLITIGNSRQDSLVTNKEYNNQEKYNSYDILNYINNNTDSIYRYQDDISLANGINFSYAKLDYRTSLYSSTSNINYLNSFYNTFNNNDIYRNHFMLSQTNNLFFGRFMGIRYLLTSDNLVPAGYKLIKKYDKGNLYENPNVYPIGYVNNNLLNIDEYNNLSFINKLESFQNNIIINGNTNNPNLNYIINKYELTGKIIKKNNLLISKTNTGYQILSNKKGKIIYSLDNSISDDNLIIRFKMNDIPSCKNGDTSITINGIMNKLTCKSWKYYNKNETFDYVISSNNIINELEMDFSKGSYNISDIEIYTVPKTFFSKNNEIVPFNINFNDTKGNIITGTVSPNKDGYFIFTIPYDDGYTLLVDGNKMEIEKVNDSFIGFPITKGNHEITLKFNAPYSNIGNIITILSGGLFIILVIIERKNLK